MKSTHVITGGSYTCRVSKQWVEVVLIQEEVGGGWLGVNVQTGRTVRIKTPRRLHAPVNDIAKLHRARVLSRRPSDAKRALSRAFDDPKVKVRVLRLKEELCKQE